MRIGELAEQTGASVRALRYYEEHDLLVSQRTGGGQRVYADDAVERVRLLRSLYGAGLNSTTIATLMPCVDTPSSDSTSESIAIMKREHARLEEQIADLATTRDQLAYLIHSAGECQHQQRDDETEARAGARGAVAGERVARSREDVSAAVG